jgi:hypothetical protein
MRGNPTFIQTPSRIFASPKACCAQPPISIVLQTPLRAFERRDREIGGLVLRWNKPTNI